MDDRARRLIDDLRAALGKYPKARISNVESPVEFLGNVSKDLGLDVFVKREDMNGPVYGGIYACALEYVFGEIVTGGYTSIVQGGPSHSNQNRLVAALGAKFGLKVHLVLRRKLSVDREDLGNLFLDQLYGAEVEWVTAEMGPELDAEKERCYMDLIADGREHPYLFRRQHVTTLGCLGILDFFLGLYEQLDRLAWMPCYIYLSGAGPTQSGMVLGTRLAAPDISVVGVRPLHWDAEGIVCNEVNGAASFLGLDLRISREDVVNYPEFVGEDYGIPTPAGNRAIEYFAQREGLVFDPVYTGKMAACFLEHTRSGRLPKGTRVLLMHTGGTPLGLLYSQDLYRDLGYSLREPTCSRELRG